MGRRQPTEVRRVAMRSQKVIVWCGFWAGGVIGPYLFENDVGEAITVNGERYRSMIIDNQFLSAQIERCGRGRHVVPEGRGYMPHSERHYGHFALTI